MIRSRLSSPRNPQGGADVPQSTIDPHEDTKFLQPRAGSLTIGQAARARRGDEAAAKNGSAETSPRSHRSAWLLVKHFLSLARGHRMSLGIALATLTVSTLLKLIPPAATKLVVDNIFPGEPLPFAERWNLPATGMPALLLLAGCVFVVSVVSLVVNTWGRYLATVTVKRLQVDLRKRVFEHAVRLPLHRVYTIKSGGVASILPRMPAA